MLKVPLPRVQIPALLQARGQLPTSLCPVLLARGRGELFTVRTLETLGA